MNKPYFPSARVWPSIFTGVENSIVVFSLAPARQGADLLVPNPWSTKPVCTSSPQILPSRPFTPGRLYSIKTSVMPMRSPTSAFLLPPLGAVVSCPKENCTVKQAIAAVISFFINSCLREARKFFHRPTANCINVLPVGWSSGIDGCEDIDSSE